jgi:hypothetical protein
MSNSYAKSVQRAVEQNGAMQPYRELFDKLPTKVLAMNSLDVVALINASIMPDFGDMAVTLTATTLGFDGYGVDAAQDLAKSLRQQHPDFNPGMAMLCRAAQLDEMYGSIWGPLIAETLVRPEEQPILYQLLFGGEPGSFKFAQRRVIEHQWAARMKLAQGTLEPRPETITEWQMRGDRVVPHGEAAYTFLSITGDALPAMVAVDIPPEFLRPCPVPTPSS